MKYSENFNVLELPDFFKFGIELEAFNVEINGKNGLYNGDSAKFITERNWHMASKSEESLVSEGGAELVSPILRDTQSDWQSISEICDHMKKYPKKGAKVIADSKCGLHIHFDSECLTSNPQIMRNFLRLYAESEELLYKMCNAQNDPIRKNAINKDFKGLHLISALWRNGMAAPTGKKILKQIEDGTLKVSYKKFNKLKMLASKYKLDERRYSGLNLTNIGNSKKNTIEFRMANGTLDPEIIKQNVFLYASLINTAIQMTNEPQLYGEQLADFFQTDVSEEQKAKSFLNLIMSDPADRTIYMDRWHSVKDAKVFSQNQKKCFAQNRFKREQFSRINLRTPIASVKQAFSKIKDMLERSQDKGDKGDYGYDR